MRTQFSESLTFLLLSFNLKRSFWIICLCTITSSSTFWASMLKESSKTWDFTHGSVHCTFVVYSGFKSTWSQHWLDVFFYFRDFLLYCLTGTQSSESLTFWIHQKLSVFDHLSLYNHIRLLRDWSKRKLKKSTRPITWDFSLCSVHCTIKAKAGFRLTLTFLNQGGFSWS